MPCRSGQGQHGPIVMKDTCASRRQASCTPTPNYGLPRKAAQDCAGGDKTCPATHQSSCKALKRSWSRLAGPRPAAGRIKAGRQRRAGSLGKATSDGLGMPDGDTGRPRKDAVCPGLGQRLAALGALKSGFTVTRVAVLKPLDGPGLWGCQHGPSWLPPSRSTPSTADRGNRMTIAANGSRRRQHGTARCRHSRGRAAASGGRPRPSSSRLTIQLVRAALDRFPEERVVPAGCVLVQPLAAPGAGSPGRHGPQAAFERCPS